MKLRRPVDKAPDAYLLKREDPALLCIKTSDWIFTLPSGEISSPVSTQAGQAQTDGLRRVVLIQEGLTIAQSLRGTEVDVVEAKHSCAGCSLGSARP